MFWSTSKTQSTSPPASNPGSSDRSGVRHRDGIEGEPSEAADERGSDPEGEAQVEDGQSRQRDQAAPLPRRQRPTPPESPSSKRGSDMAPPSEN